MSVRSDWHSPGRLEGQGTAQIVASHGLAGGRRGSENGTRGTGPGCHPSGGDRLYRTVCRWWKEIEVLIITGATTGKVEANNTAIKNIKRTARGYRNPDNYKSVIL
ncbi:MAG: transposase for insertion sequence element [Pseudarthrobacter sp.]|nr:transposase for insertion sequence element [Pseudarthrobacter sp.]